MLAGCNSLDERRALGRTSPLTSASATGLRFGSAAVAVLDDQSQLVWIDVQRVDDRARLPGRCFEEFSKLVEGIVAVTVELMEFAMEATRQPDAVFGDEAELRISVIRI